MEIRSLKGISYDRIFSAFSKAFEDYEMQLDRKQLSEMLNRRGFFPELSFAAFDGDNIIAFTLNGIGLFGGIKTAYDTGTGTIREFRGRGLATRIFEYSIPCLKRNDIKQYLLEVLQQNSQAVSVYTKLGFDVSREFNYFKQKSDDVNFKLKTLESGYLIREIELDDCKLSEYFADFSPSWQNNFDAINRKQDKFKAFGALFEGKLIAFCILEVNTGDIPQIAVANAYRRKGIASQLLKEALKQNKNTIVKIINTDTRCSSITKFLKSINIPLKGKQFEMIKKL
jgi:ribosomal protein S18 acetylase RimI-like enzyme